MAEYSETGPSDTKDACQDVAVKIGDRTSTSRAPAQALSDNDDDDDDEDSSVYKKSWYNSRVSIPSVITGTQSTMMSKNLHLFDGDSHEPILLAETHLGYSYKTPLGFIPGTLLYNGTSKKEQVLAAAGAKSLVESRIYSFPLASDIWLARLVPTALSTALTPETMHARTLDDGVAFTFTIVVEKPRNRKFPRETFEWRKVKKCQGDNDNDSIGGFNLLWLAGKSQPGAIDADGTVKPGESSKSSQPLKAADAGQGDIVATLSYGTYMHEPN